MKSDRDICIAFAVSFILHLIFLKTWVHPENSFIPADETVITDVESGPALITASISCEHEPPDPGQTADNASRPLNRQIIIKQFITRVRKKIERNKFYPPGGNYSQIIGNADIGFSIDQRGFFKDIRLLRSSGDTCLDATALRAVAHMSGRVKRPASTGRRPIRAFITLKYQYGL